MKKERRYRALYDNAHEYGCEIYYYSSSRAGSRENALDCYRAITAQGNYSWNRVRNFQILQVNLDND